MKSLVVVVMISMLMSLLAGCGVKTIEPGHVGIKVNRTGSQRGVSKEDLVSGWVFYMPVLSRVIEYPVFNQRVVWSSSPHEGSPNNEEISFQTRDNVPVTMDIAVNYTLREDKVPDFYTKFRADKIEYFTHGYMRDQVRNAASQMASEYLFDDINGSKKEEFLTKLNDQLSKAVEPYGVVTGKNSLSLIGAFRVPDNLRNAIGARVQAIQDAMKAENELRVYKANAAKAVAQAEGEAAAMRAKSSSITPQLLELKRLEIQLEQIHKWNGAYPTTMLGNGTSTLFSLK